MFKGKFTQSSFSDDRKITLQNISKDAVGIIESSSLHVSDSV